MNSNDQNLGRTLSGQYCRKGYILVVKPADSCKVKNNILN
jgi:hypothetical protein